MTEHVWSDFTYFGIYVVYKNRTGKWTGKRLFSLYQRYFQYQRLQEMTVFDRYSTGIWHHGITITPFFIAALLLFFLVKEGEFFLIKGHNMVEHQCVKCLFICFGMVTVTVQLDFCTWQILKLQCNRCIFLMQMLTNVRLITGARVKVIGWFNLFCWWLEV